MFARRATCSPLRLDDEIGRNVHTTRFNGKNVHTANLDTKGRVYLERHSGDVTLVNTALAMVGRVHFALLTIATMPPLVHNLLFFAPHRAIKSTL